MTKPAIQPVCLTIAGLDPSGGAGVVADIKTFAAFGCFATAALTSVTFQNTTGVFGAIHQSADSVRRQIEAVLDDFDVAAVKTGMLPSGEIIETIASFIRKRGIKNVVVDPVVRSTSGFDLIDDAALRSLITHLFPLADIVTPNIAEAERIAGIEINSEEDIRVAAGTILRPGARGVLIKGGHLNLTDTPHRKAIDYLFCNDTATTFEADYIDSTSTHGTGCTLSAAIAANLALGKTVYESVRVSKKFVTEAIRTAPGLGHGNGPLNHLVAIDSDD